MAMVCNRCSTTHEQALHCPTCGNALVYCQPRRRGKSYAELARGWQHTDWGRFVVGVGLAQGLFYGLYHLIKSLVLATTGEPLNSATMPMAELLCIQSLQLFGLVVGSVIAGVARRQAHVLGVYIGVANSILSLLLGQGPAQAFTTHWVYAQPFLQILVGSVGALVSSLVWKPLSVVTLPESPSRMAQRLGPKRPRLLKVFVGPISWFRVGLGTLFAIAGCLTAQPLLALVLSVSDSLSLNEYMQEWVLIWEIKAVALLLGGMAAGAGTVNGIKQGLVAGIVTGAVLNVVLAFRHTTLELVAFSMLLSFGLALAGGWFGGQLFPPVVSRKRLKGLGPGTA